MNNKYNPNPKYSVNSVRRFLVENREIAYKNYFIELIQSEQEKLNEKEEKYFQALVKEMESLVANKDEFDDYIAREKRKAKEEQAVTI